MNPMDEIKTGAAGIADKIGGENPKLVQEVIKLVQNFPGGVSGLVKQFQDRGLGSVATALTGKAGTATPTTITPEQVAKGFGSDKITALATATGLDSKTVQEKLATILPKIVQELAPAGTASSK